jgi:hypothetical protein
MQSLTVVMLACRTLLRLQLWRSSNCTLALEAVSREDQEQHECEQQLKDLLQVRLLAFTLLFSCAVIFML